MADRKTTPNILDDLMSASPAGAQKPTATTLRIAEIRRDGGTQPRAGLDEAHVQDLVAAIAAGDELPPVDVVFDGTAYWLYDGYHRTEATSRSGKYTVQAIIHQGTQQDAQWMSYAANSRHGLKRTNDDKRRQVIAALRHPNGASMSNREIARHVGVDEGTVREYRARMESAAEIPQVTERKGADGKVYDTAKIGTNRPAQPKRDDAAEDAWRPPGIGARTMQQQVAAPLKRAVESDIYAVLEKMSPTCDLFTVDPGWRLDYVESALLRQDMQMRRDLIDDCINDWLRQRRLRHGIEDDVRTADPYRHDQPQAIINDLAAQEAQRLAAADIAFGMAPTRTQVLAKLLQDIMDAIPELSKLTGKTNDCIVLQSAATKVYGALVATPAPTDLPEELKALGWELRRGSHTGRWYAAIKITGEEEEIKTMGRSDISIVVEDCRFMNKSLEIGA